MSYKEHIVIDLDNLETEWAKQVKLSDEYGEMHVKAVAERDRLKKKLEILGAQLDSEIRKQAIAEGRAKKPTENEIANKIILSEEHQNLSEKLIEANERVNKMALIKDDFMQKLTSLKYLTKLYLGSYFTDNLDNKSKGSLRLYDRHGHDEEFHERMNKKYGRRDD